MMTCQRLAMIFALLVAGSLGVSQHVSLAGEGQGAVSRADLVAAVERGPGPAKGSAEAPVVMVEFSDFQCVYCRKFWRETLPKIEDRYIRRGQVRFVYRYLAVLGEGSILAAQAAACANDQEKFWEYHDTLFTKTGPLAFTSARLKRYAAELGLDERVFAECFDGRKQAQRVEAETTLGHALGATGTPAFLLNGQLVIGAYPFEAFQQALDGLLASPRRERSGQAR